MRARADDAGRRPLRVRSDARQGRSDPRGPQVTGERTLTRNFHRPDAHTLAAYRGTGGYTAWEKAQTMEPAAIPEGVKKANLRGLGGARLPTGMKRPFIPKNHPRPVYLVINGAEREPGTVQDR